MAKRNKSKSDNNRQASPAPGRPPAGAWSTAAQADAGGSKADSIRDVARRLPKPVRPRDVIAELAQQGIDVSRGQVSQVLRGMGMRRRRGRRSKAASTRSTATASVTISLNDLLAAKKLADQLGGVAAAKEAVDALAKLS